MNLLSVLVILVIVTLAAFSGCTKSTRIESIRITGDANNISRGELRFFFTDDDEPVICEVDLARVYEPIELSTTWYYLPRGTIVFESSSTIKKPGKETVRLSRKPGESEHGYYRVEVSLDAEIQSVLFFQVVDDLPEPISEDEISELFRKLLNIEEMEEKGEPDIISDFKIARSIYHLTQAPKEVADEFPPNAEVIYLTLLLTGAQEGTKALVEWHYIGTEVGMKPRLLVSAGLTTSGTRNLAFNLKPGTGDLPEGEYEARVFLNGTHYTTLRFRVKPERMFHTDRGAFTSD